MQMLHYIFLLTLGSQWAASTDPMGGGGAGFLRPARGATKPESMSRRRHIVPSHLPTAHAAHEIGVRGLSALSPRGGLFFFIPLSVKKQGERGGFSG